MSFGNSIHGNGTWMGFAHPEINHVERKKYLTLGEPGYYDLKKGEVMEFVRQYPNYFAEFCFRRFLLFWWDYGDVDGDTVEIIRTYWERTFATLALLGVIFALRQRRPGAWLMAAVLVVYPLPYYLTFPYGRYRHIIEPLLLLFSVYTLAPVRELRRWFILRQD